VRLMILLFVKHYTMTMEMVFQRPVEHAKEI